MVRDQASPIPMTPLLSSVSPQEPLKIKLHFLPRPSAYHSPCPFTPARAHPSPALFTPARAHCDLYAGLPNEGCSSFSNLLVHGMLQRSCQWHLPHTHTHPPGVTAMSPDICCTHPGGHDQTNCLCGPHPPHLSSLDPMATEASVPAPTGTTPPTLATSGFIPELSLTMTHSVFFLLSPQGVRDLGLPQGVSPFSAPRPVLSHAS